VYNSVIRTTIYWVERSLIVRLNGMPFYAIEQLLRVGNVTSLQTGPRHFSGKIC